MVLALYPEEPEKQSPGAKPVAKEEKENAPPRRHRQQRHEGRTRGPHVAHQSDGAPTGMPRWRSCWPIASSMNISRT